jgi:hypothetical protein
MPNLKLFNAGLNTATAPHLIPSEAAVEYTNINNVPGLLTPIKDKVSTVAGAQKYGYNFLGTWYFSSTVKDWVEFQERLYIGNREGISTYILGGVEYNLGISAPTVQPTLTPDNALPPITRADQTVITTGGDLEGGINVQYQAVNISSTGRKSAASKVLPKTTPTTTNTNRFNIGFSRDTGFGTGGVQIFRELDGFYRQLNLNLLATTIYNDAVDNVSARALISDFAPVGPDGTVGYALTFYNNNTGNESVPLVIPEANYIHAEVVFTNLQVSTDTQVTHKRLYRIGGSNTVYTLVVQLPNATTTYSDEADDDDLEGSLLQSSTFFPAPSGLKYMTEAYAMFFAAKDDKLYFTPIGMPAAWPETFFLDFPRQITGIAKTPIGLLVFDLYTTYLITGTGPLSLAQQILTGDQGCISHESIVNVQGAAYWMSTDGLCISEGGKVVIWTRPWLNKLNYLGTIVNAVTYDQQYYLHTIDGKTLIIDIERNVIKQNEYGIESLNIADDVLYGFSGSALHTLETATTALSMAYKGPWNIGNGLSNQKTYKNIYVFSTGTVTIEIYISDVLAQTVTLTGTDNHQIKIPNNFTRGFWIQFKVTGTGSVYEISWEDGNPNA